MNRKTTDRLYMAGFSLLLLGTVLIPFSAWVGGSLFYASIGVIIVTTGLSIHWPRRA